MTPSYQQRLLEQLSGITQATNLVARYMARFDEPLIICDLDKAPSFTLPRFKNGLRFGIHRALSSYSLDSLNHVF